MRNPLWIRIAGTLTALLLALPLPVMAQGGEEPFPQQSAQKQFSREELAQLVAPIALYPDELVAQILMASTYPLEIVEADRWVQQNRALRGDPLAEELEQKNWDPSVKSLVAFPSVLSMMSRKLEVTSKLGDAFLNQEEEVMATIQALRKRAYDAGNLTGTREQKVLVEQESIIIQSATPEVIYVPTYNPAVVYGAWMYPGYPPYPYYAYPPPAYGTFAFATGITLGLAWGYAWGGCNWHGRSVNVNIWRNTTFNIAHINRNNYQRNYQKVGMVGQNGQGRWRHDAEHRRGVAYRDPATARLYGQSPARSPQTGRDARGYGTPGGARETVPGVRAPGWKPPGGSPTPPRNTERNQGGTKPNGIPSGGEQRDTRGAGRVGGGPAFGGSYGDGASSRAASDRGHSSRQPSGGARQESGGGGTHGGGGGGRDDRGSRR